MIKSICTYIHMHIITINGNKAMTLKESKERCMRELRGTKENGELTYFIISK